MDVAHLVENGKLVGVVDRTAADEFRHERRLAGETSSYNQDRQSSPADHAGMHEEPLA